MDGAPLRGETAAAGGGRRMGANRRSDAARTGVRRIAVYFRDRARGLWVLEIILGQLG